MRAKNATTAGAWRLSPGLSLSAAVLTVLLAGCTHTPRAVAPLAASAASPPSLTFDPKAGGSATPDAETVNIDLVAQTRRHASVTDLDASQLTVRDGGSPVALTALRRVTPSAASLQPVSFVFDQLNPGSARFARPAAEKLLSAIPDQGYDLAVFQVSGRLRLLQGFTGDFHQVDVALAEASASTLAAGTAALTPAEKVLLASAQSNALRVDAADRARQASLLAALVQSQKILEDRPGYPALAALEALVQSDASLPGRKFILYFSNGTPMHEDSHERLQSLVSEANRAGVTIYIINANSVTAEMNSAMATNQASTVLATGGGSSYASAFGVSKSTGTAGTAGDTGMPHNISGYEFGDIRADQSPAIALAAGTGGLYFAAASDFNQQRMQLHEELSSWYQATWTSPARELNGQFRPIEIRTGRKNLLVRTRSGYFALPSASSAGILPFEVPLARLLNQTVFPSEIPMRAGVLHLGNLPGGNCAELLVQVPIAQLARQVDDTTGIASVHAAILAVIKDSQGKVLERFSEDFPLHEAPGLHGHQAVDTVTLERPFTADPGTYTLETAVMDRLGNKAAAERTTFTMQASPAGPVLSDIALVGRIEPADEKIANLEPMIYLDGRVVPRLSAELPGDTRSIALFFLLHPDPASASQPQLRMQIVHEDQVLVDTPLELRPRVDLGAPIPYLATLRGHAFPPGLYQARAVLSQGASSTSSSISFQVQAVPGPAGPGNTATNAPPAETPSTPVPAGGLDPNSPALTLLRAEQAIPPPSPDEIHAMLDDARERALAWSDSLKNFTCLEVTNHFVNAQGEHDWKYKATLVEFMRNIDHVQTRTTVSLNGQRSSAAPNQFDFAHSRGEFGAMFHVIFDPGANAAITWKETAFLDGQPLQVFTFQVPRAHSSFNLSDRSHIRTVGFHGLLYLDPATRSIRRVTLIADDIPPGLLIDSSSVTVDYTWVPMQNHEYLLPVRGSVTFQETKRQPILNQFEFHSYRRFGSQVRIVPTDDLKPLPGN